MQRLGTIGFTIGLNEVRKVFIRKIKTAIKIWV